MSILPLVYGVDKSLSFFTCNQHGPMRESRQFPAIKNSFRPQQCHVEVTSKMQQDLNVRIGVGADSQV